MKNSSVELLDTYFITSLESGTNAPQFFVLEGISHLTCDHALVKILKSFLGVYSETDFLRVRDFSRQLGKEHILKVKMDSRAPSAKQLAQDFQYTDIGVREINVWLQQSSFSGKKIVLIENIERMNIAAVNAFLKTAEEPREGKLIVATTQNKSLLLDTLLSRAIVFSVSDMMNKEQLLAHIADVPCFSSQPELKEIVVELCLGDIQTLDSFVNFLQDHEDMYRFFSELGTTFSQGKGLTAKFEFLKSVADAGLIVAFVHGLIAWYVQREKRAVAQIWLEVKQLLLVNVSVQQVLMYGLVKLGL